MSRESRVNKSRSRVSEKTQPTERTLPLEPCGDIVREGHYLVGCAQDKLSGVEYEGFSGVDFDQTGEIGLISRRINVLILVIVEEAEEAVESHIDARWLHHRLVPRVENDPFCLDFCTNIPVR